MLIVVLFGHGAIARRYRQAQGFAVNSSDKRKPARSNLTTHIAGPTGQMVKMGYAAPPSPYPPPGDACRRKLFERAVSHRADTCSHPNDGNNERRDAEHAKPKHDGRRGKNFNRRAGFHFVFSPSEFTLASDTR
ncbi:protein of unknown function [Pararobbsia alpina]